jgi:hypothetical protein
VNEGRTKLLLGLLGLLVLFVVWRYVGPSSTNGGGNDDFGPVTSMGRIPGASREVKPPVEEVLDLRVADLQARPHDYRPGRDPWRFAEPPPPPPPPPPPQPTAEQIRAQQEEAERLRLMQEEAARRAAELAAIPKPPPFTMKCLGKFGPAARPIAVFTNGKDILNVQQGEVIEGKFIVSQIGFESVEIRFVGFPNEPAQRLPIGR